MFGIFRKGQPASPPANGPDDPLCLVFIPALVTILLNVERKTGRPLTEAEVIAIRDKAVCMTMPGFEGGDDGSEARLSRHRCGGCLVGMAASQIGTWAKRRIADRRTTPQCKPISPQPRSNRLSTLTPRTMAMMSETTAAVGQKRKYATTSQFCSSVPASASGRWVHSDKP